jgi:hypothetical protein
MGEEQAGTVTGEESVSSQTEEETQASTEEVAASTEIEGSDEVVEGEGTEEQDKSSKRFQELANAKRELSEKLEKQDAQIKELAAKFEEQQKASQAPGAIDETALANYLTDAEFQIETLKAEGKILDAKLLQRKVDKLLDDVEAHRAKEAEWRKTATASELQQSQTATALKELDGAAEFFREAKHIPKDVWEKGADQWAELRKTDPLLDRQYAEVWQRQGPVAAINFAYDHIQKTQTAEAEKLKLEKANKDKGKGGIPGGGASGPGKGIASWDQLTGLGTKVMVEYKKNNPKHYQELLDKHMSK